MNRCHSPAEEKSVYCGYGEQVDEHQSMLACDRDVRAHAARTEL
jgi:hypothetical protein